MKLFYNTLLVLLCLCTVSIHNVNAQDGLNIEASSHVMQVNMLGPDSMGQSFYHPEDEPIYSISFAIHDRRAIEDRAGKLVIFEGEGLNGNVVFDTTIVLPGINKFYSSTLMATVPNGAQALGLWQHTNDSILNGSYSFDQVKVECIINKHLTVGQYTVFVTTDVTVPDVYNGGDTHAPELVVYLNCTEAFECQNDTVLNPYPGGQMLVSQYATSSLMDMAFEIKTGEFFTGVSDNSPQNLSVTIENGSLLIPSDWQGDDVLICNTLGQSTTYEKVPSGKLIPLTKGQVSFVSRLHLGKRQTAKVFVL
jgi:hypothetical protein